MPQATRLGDLCTGHQCWPTRPNDEASPDFFINGIQAHRVGDSWSPHTCPSIPETHSSILATGSPDFFVNGKQLGRIGDLVACGSLVMTGSPDFFVNGD